jgi:hypothetical protein
VTIKYNSTGQRQWTATYFERGDRAFVGNAIVVDAQGGVYVAGTATVKYDNAGRQLWLNTNLVTTAVTLDKSGQVWSLVRTVPQSLLTPLPLLSRPSGFTAPSMVVDKN